MDLETWHTGVCHHIHITKFNAQWQTVTKKSISLAKLEKKKKKLSTI